MVCGVRNDFKHPDGLCKNDHDAWLEYRDVKDHTEWFDLMLEKTGLTAAEFEKKFVDITIKQFEFIK